MLITASNFTPNATEAELPPGTPLILWDNVATFGTVTADSEADGYPASNLTNPATNLEWIAESPSPVTLVEWTIISDGVTTVDAVGIARHNFGTAGILIELGYYDNDSPDNWVNIVGPTLITDDEPILIRFTAMIPQEALKVRIYQDDIIARAAVLYVGKLLVMERGVDAGSDYPIPRFSRKTEFYNARSERGDYLGRIVTSQWIQGVDHSYKHLTPTWYRTYFDPFVRAAQQDVPFFYCFAPVDYPNEVAFCWLADDPIGLTSPVTDRVGVILKIDGIIE